MGNMITKIKGKRSSITGLTTTSALGYETSKKWTLRLDI